MSQLSFFGGKLKYQLSKMLPLNSDVTISLRNGLQFVVRAKTMDRSVLKEVWLREIYNKHGVSVEKGDTVLDIGGHIGIFSIYAAHLSETGVVYAFEPFSENFKRLERHKQINRKENLKVFNKGVADKEGKQILFLSPDKNTGGHSMHLKNESTRKVEIDTINIIDFCDQNNIQKIDFLKLDCEGAEFDILKNSEAILDRVKKIIMECHPYGENTCDKMVALLEKRGFQVIRESNHIGGIEMLYCSRT